MSQRAPERFGGLFKFGIMVALCLDVVAHPDFRRDQNPRVGSTGLGLLGVALKLAKRSVKTRNPFRHRRRVVRKLDELVSTDAEVSEHRVRIDFCKLRRSAAVAALSSEGLHVNIERLCEAKENAGRDRPLIAFEMIEIGAGYTELIGHLALVKSSFAPKPLEPCTEEELSLKHHHL